MIKAYSRGMENNNIHRIRTRTLSMIKMYTIFMDALHETSTLEIKFNLNNTFYVYEKFCKKIIKIIIFFYIDNFYAIF